MTAGDGKSRFSRLLCASAKNLLEHFEWQNVRWKRRNGETEDWGGPHGVDVGDRVGGRDRTEKVRVVNDWREEVDCLRDCLIAADSKHRGVIAGAMTDEKILQPFIGREFRQDRV